MPGVNTGDEAVLHCVRCKGHFRYSENTTKLASCEELFRLALERLPQLFHQRCWPCARLRAIYHTHGAEAAAEEAEAMEAKAADDEA